MTVWTPERHAAARKACEAATKGPWWMELHRIDDQVDGHETFGIVFVKRGADDDVVLFEACGRADSPYATGRGQANMLLVVTARTDLPAALDEIERLNAALADAYRRGQESMRENAALIADNRELSIDSCDPDQRIVSALVNRFTSGIATTIRALPLRPEGEQ